MILRGGLVIHIGDVQLLAVIDLKTKEYKNTNFNGEKCYVSYCFGDCMIVRFEAAVWRTSNVIRSKQDDNGIIEVMTLNSRYRFKKNL